MKNYYQAMNLEPVAYVGQFILSKKADRVPEGWRRYEQERWCLGVNGLPVYIVEDGTGQLAGWCIGYPLKSSDTVVGKISMPGGGDGSIDMHAVNDFYSHTGGKYILILLYGNEEKLFLDPYGSLGTVYSTTEPTVASTPTLITSATEWDEDTINTLEMPQSGLWFPSGTTPKKEVKRLLPNHCLDLGDWNVGRHWPSDSAELAVERDAQQGVNTIVSYLRRNIEAVTKQYPVQLSLTAGRDSRMLLACTKDYLPRASFFTFAEQQETVDTHIAALLSKKFNLKSRFIPIQYASEEEMHHWLDITGYSVSGGIWRIHKSIQDLDPECVLLPGISGEVGRSYYWRQNDGERTCMSARELLSRAHLPCNDSILRETDSWLSGLSGYSTFNILDLFYIEQRLGCWAAPQHYGNTTSVYECSPFNHRQIFSTMMKLPYDYRRREELANDICRSTWPELLKLPFNDFTGFGNFTRKTKRLGLKVARKIRSII